MLDGYAFLYVEDDPLSRQVMQLLMVDAMNIQQLTIFQDSNGFMDRLRALPTKPDIILLDIHMKPLDGFALLQLLRTDQDYQQTRVIALTASVMNEEVERLKHSGFDGAVAKPLSIRTFPVLLERIVKGESVWHIV